MKSISYSIVQIQARQFRKGEKICLGFLEGMVPDHSYWEDLTTPSKETRDEDDIFLIGNNDSIFKEDAIGLLFNSVGDWSDGATSSFDYERCMVGINELVSSYMSDIIMDVEKRFKPPSPYSTIVTLWETEAWRDYDGEWDSATIYLGIFDISRVQELLL